MKTEDAFLEFVTQEAKRQTGKNFILNCGEGREMENAPSGMDVEDLSGWLMSDEEIKLHPCKTSAERRALFKYDLPFVFALWKYENNRLSVDFKEFPI